MTYTYYHFSKGRLILFDRFSRKVGIFPYFMRDLQRGYIKLNGTNQPIFLDQQTLTTKEIE